MTTTEIDTVELALGPQRWRALLALIGEPTSDGRIFDSLTWRDLPLSLLFQPSNETGHDGAVIVGRIDDITQTGNEVWGEGEFLTPTRDYRWPAVAMDLVRQQALKGVSVDASVLDMTDTEDGLRHFDGEIGAATLVAFPAFADASIELVDAPESAPVTAYDLLEDLAVSGSTSLPLADRMRPWDGSAAQQRVKAWAGGNTPNARYAQAFFIVDGPADQYGSYHLGFADVVNGTLTAIPRGIIACAGAVQGARGASNPAFQAAKPKIAAYYRKMDMTPPWQSAGAEQIVAFDSAVGLLASAATIVEASDFARPQLTRRERLHVDTDGRVWGHIYGWGECHIGSPPGRCIQPTPSATNYAYFLTGCVLTEDGEIPVGQICLSADHASLSASWIGARDHYAHTALAVADVTCGEDEHGIWVAGRVRPGTSDEMIHALRASAPSGDWRPVGKSLELVAVLAVNTPGFPQLQARIEGGRVMALVASGQPADCGCESSDLDEVLTRLAQIEADVAPIRAAANAEREELIADLERDLGLDAETVIAAMAVEIEGPPDPETV